MEASNCLIDAQFSDEISILLGPPPPPQVQASSISTSALPFGEGITTY